jgi:uncharacterized protein YqgQ
MSKDNSLMESLEFLPGMLEEFDLEVSKIDERVTVAYDVLKEFGSVLHYEDDRIQFMQEEITRMRDAQISMQKTLSRIETYLQARDSELVYERNKPYWDQIRQLQESGEHDEAWKLIERRAPNRKYFADSS